MGGLDPVEQDMFPPGDRSRGIPEVSESSGHVGYGKADAVEILVPGDAGDFAGIGAGGDDCFSANDLCVVPARRF